MYVNLMKSNSPWSFYEFKIIQKMLSNKNSPKKNQWLCNFTFLTSPWPIRSLSSTVVCERIKLNKTDVISLIIHTLKDIAENVCKKRQQPKKSKVGFLLKKMSQLFPFDIIWQGMGAKVLRPNMSPPDRNRNPYKSHSTNFFFLLIISLLCRHLYLLHLGIPLIISSHASIGVCLSVVFNTTQDSSVCLSASYSAPHEMAENASNQIHRHGTVRQCLYLCTNFTFT